MQVEGCFQVSVLCGQSTGYPVEFSTAALVMLVHDDVSTHEAEEQRSECTSLMMSTLKEVIHNEKCSLGVYEIHAEFML